MLYKWTLPPYITKVPQCETMTSDYYYRVNRMGIKGVALPKGKLDYTPYADAFKMQHNTRKTDYVTSNQMTSLDWLVSPPFADFLQTFNLPEFQVFDAVVEHRGKRYPYKILHFGFDTLEVIDFEQSTWYVTNLGYNTKACERISISHQEEYKLKSEILWLERKLILPRKLAFVNTIDTQIVRLSFSSIGLIINEPLKTAIQAAGFTGIDFAEVPNPLIQYLVWADTGLPVED